MTICAYPRVSDRPIEAEVAAVPACAPVRVRSTELLRGAHEVLIEHPIGNEVHTYRLRRTVQGKLILTK